MTDGQYKMKWIGWPDNLGLITVVISEVRAFYEVRILPIGKEIGAEISPVPYSETVEIPNLPVNDYVRVLVGKVCRLCCGE